MSVAWILSIAVLPVGTALAQSAHPPAAAGLEAARIHAKDALANFNAGRFHEAAAGFVKADEAFPAPQYRLFLARSLVNVGKLASAVRAYEQASAMPEPTSVPPGFREAQVAAKDELAELRPRVPAVQIVVKVPATGWLVTIDDVPLGANEVGRVEVDPGRHVVVAKAEGYEAQTRSLEARPGALERIDFVLRAKPRTGARGALASPIGVDPGVPVRNEPIPPPTLSHRRQLGANPTLHGSCALKIPVDFADFHARRGAAGSLPERLTSPSTLSPTISSGNRTISRRIPMQSGNCTQDSSVSRFARTSMCSAKTRERSSPLD